jgi:hypothetical protein
MDLRIDRIGLLLDQLVTSKEISRERLAGLTEEEFFWEPAPGAWSLRRRAEATSPMAYGAGEWLLDFALPEPNPAPVTTIAWRLSHLFSGFSLRWEWTFGGRTRMEEDIEFSPSPAEAIDRLWKITERWATDLDALTDEQLDTVGFGQFPHGLDPQLPIIQIVWWTNREFISHMAEIATLRDLWAAR